MTCKACKTTLLTLIILLMLMAVESCSSYRFRKNYKEANALLHDNENYTSKLFLKAHLKNGDIYILRDTWEIDTTTNIVSGYGVRYNFNRDKVYEGNIELSIDSVAIFETNKILEGDESDRIAALAIMGSVNLGFTAFCATNPKACFGSCPTFYVQPQSDLHYSDAEGFSSAISPSLEYGDVDALNNGPVPPGPFSLYMKNEALETHCINDVQLWAVPRQPGERIYHSPDDRFYKCGRLQKPATALAPEGDINPLVEDDDRTERYSMADSSNLSSKEEILLTFPPTPPDKYLGLVINFRQTLMTTYFIYSAMGYMGDEVGDIFAKLEQDNGLNETLQNGLKKELGKIDVYLWNTETHEWELQGGLYETGPIAYNRQIVPFKNLPTGNEVKVKLVLNKGLWRIDHLALATIKAEVEPVKVLPARVSMNGQHFPKALHQLAQPDEHLISMPGDHFHFEFDLPPNGMDYELFLYSKGYYLEWMRTEWLADKDLLKLRQMFYQPKRYLKGEAENYKTYEQTMEEQFWNSRIEVKDYTYATD